MKIRASVVARSALVSMLGIVLLLIPASPQAPAALDLRAASEASFQNPAARAAYLGLPAPKPGRGADHEVCATDITRTFPQACFESGAEAGRYISSTVEPGDGQQQTVSLTGSGGVTALAYGPATELGRTCANIDCTTFVQYFFMPAGGNTCSHTYIQNDYFYNNAYAYTSARWSRATTNCGFVGIYLNGTQGGGGAKGCYIQQGFTAYFTCPGETGLYGTYAYHSISWSNNN